MRVEGIAASKGKLEEARERFEAWRKSRKNYRPIPADLWTAAVELTRQYPINTVSRALRLNYSDLKRHIKGTSDEVTSGGAFVEVNIPMALTVQSIVEIEHREGNRLRIYSTDSIWGNFAALAHALWDKHR